MTSTAKYRSCTEITSSAKYRLYTEMTSSCTDLVYILNTRLNTYLLLIATVCLFVAFNVICRRVFKVLNRLQGANEQALIIVIRIKRGRGGIYSVV